MMRNRIHLLSPLASCLAIALTACGSSDTSTDGPGKPVSDAGVDTEASVDAQPDVAPDVIGEDAPPDAAPDAPAEVGPDAPAEVGPDAPLDALGDGPGPDQDSGNPWPTCDTQPSGVPDMTLPQIWTSNPTAPTEVWITGLFVTAISWGGCSSGNACQVFLQDAETFATFTAGAHHGMKLFISGPAAGHFATLQVGDRVNVYAHAWRYDLNPAQNELLLQVNNALRGCAKTVGTGAPTPIEGVELTDLTVDAYENTHGPLLVKVDGVSGKPAAANETFALWKTGGPFVEAGIETVVNASPYFLSGGSFTTLPTDGNTIVDFSSITGVFGLFVPSADGGAGAKYLMLYPRTMTDMPTL
jgi:hypothetical protein